MSKLAPFRPCNKKTGPNNRVFVGNAWGQPDRQCCLLEAVRWLIYLSVMKLSSLIKHTSYYTEYFPNTPRRYSFPAQSPQNSRCCSLYILWERQSAHTALAIFWLIYPSNFVGAEGEGGGHQFLVQDGGPNNTSGVEKELNGGSRHALSTIYPVIIRCHW